MQCSCLTNVGAPEILLLTSYYYSFIFGIHHFNVYQTAIKKTFNLAKSDAVQCIYKRSPKTRAFSGYFCKCMGTQFLIHSVVLSHKYA